MRLILEIECDGVRDVHVKVEGGKCIRRRWEESESEPGLGFLRFDRDAKTIQRGKVSARVSPLEMEIVNALTDGPQTLDELRGVWGDPLLIWDNVNAVRVKLNRKIRALGLSVNRVQGRLMLKDSGTERETNPP